MRPFVAGALSLALIPLTAGGAYAQVTPPLLAPIAVDAPQVSGSCVAGATVQTTIQPSAGSPIRLGDTMCAAGAFTVDTRAVPLRNGYQVSVTQTVNGTVSAVHTLAVGRGPFGPPYHDERADFEASAYVGLAIDTFGSPDVQRYLNPEANGEIHERSIFGFDFAYRLLRAPAAPVQVWVYGESLHGVRSEEIDCGEASNLPSCQQELAGFAGNIGTSALYMLRNATSLEGYLGVRAELWPLNLPGRHPAVVYVNLQKGFLQVEGSDGDVKAMDVVAVGARAVGGALQGSYLELGLGKTELFRMNRDRRWKIDGMLQQEIAGGFSLFAQLFVDVDNGPSADAIQSYLGLTFDVPKIVAGLKALADN